MSYEFLSISPCEIRKKVEKSIKLLLKNDSSLLYYNAHEISITHKLAEYLQLEFPELNVDCEYNRNGHESVKKLADWTKKHEEELDKDQNNEKNVFPDIIVHQRGKRDNLLVIEVKKSVNNDNGDSDKDKIQAFRDELEYDYGLFINFKTDKKSGIEDLDWFPSEEFEGCDS